MASSVTLFHWLQDSYNSAATNEDIWGNVSWSSYQNLNVSKYDDLSVVTPYVTSGKLDSLHPLSNKALDLLAEYTDLLITTSAAKLGLTSGLFLSLILKSKLYTPKLLELSKFQIWFQEMILGSLFAAVCLILAIIVAPFFGAFIIVLMCYRQGVNFYLRMTQPQYVQLFEGLDAIWAVEEESSRSIINVLAFIEVDSVEEGSNLLNTFRNIIMNRLATPPLPCAKLFYLRRQCFGYFYWEQQSELKIENYIRPMTTILPDNQQRSCNSSDFPHRISEETLKNIVGELSNTMLPKDHAACWEILVGSQPIEKSSVFLQESLESKKLNFSKISPGKRLQYPVMFRIHHSLGDGIALMQLLMSHITDTPSPSTPQDIECKHSPRLPPIPMPVRKFQPLNNCGSSTIHMKDCCKIGENSLHNSHKAQSPAEFHITQPKLMSDERCSELNNISIDFQKLEESSAVIFHNDKKNEPEIILRSVPSCSHVETNSVTMKYRERPLLLKNSSESLDQIAKSSFHEKICSKLERKTQVNSMQIPCPTPETVTEFKTSPDYYTKISRSYNQPLTSLTTGKLSPSLNSNFQTSLPVLNLCKTPKSMPIVQKLSQNKTPSRNYESENNSTNSLQDIKCQTTTLTRTSLEEPPYLFNKSKSTSSCPIPKSTYKLPTPSKIPCSKNMTLHCYKHTMSDSYITIPEDVECSIIGAPDKYTNTSTTIYYYSSPAISSMNPTPLNNVTPQKLIQSNKSISYHSNEQIILLSDKISSSESSLEEISVVKPAKTISHPSSPIASSLSLSLKSTPVNMDKCTTQNTNYFGWKSVGTTQNRKTKSDGDLNRIPKIYNPGSEVQSTTAMNSTHKNYRIKNVSTLRNTIESPNIHDRPLSNIIDQNDKLAKNETKVTLDNQEEQDSEQWFSGLTLNCNKLLNYFKGTKCKETNTTEFVTQQQSNDPNQYVQLLNTISNSTCSLRKPEIFSQLLQTLCVLALSPASLIHQMLMKVTDRNVLHGPPLTGYKVIAWHRDPNGELFNRMKKIKSCFNVRFTEVFLTALSASLETYFEIHQSYNAGIPDIVNVVIPARMEQPKCNTTVKKLNMTQNVTRKDKRLQQKHSLPHTIPEEDIIKFSPKKTITNDFSKPIRNISREMQEREDKMKDKDCNMPSFDLNNRFSVAMLQLPVSQATQCEYQRNEYTKLSPRRRLAAVCHNSELLRKSPDYQVNYWLLKVVASCLTKRMLTAVVHSSHSTLVVSNIMGPTQERSFAGSKLQDIMFWVPHRGTTGIGITVLSYMGHLQIGIMADRAVIHCKDDAQMILDETVTEMSKLDAISF